MFTAVSSWFDRQRPAPRHAEEPAPPPHVPAPENIEQLVMRRAPSPDRVIDPCEIRFALCSPNIVARFFDAQGRATGQTDHPHVWSVSDFVDFYWPRGWEVAEWRQQDPEAQSATESRQVPADAFTPPDAEAMAMGRWEAPTGDAGTVSVALDNREAVVTPTSPAHYPDPNPARIAGGYADGGPLPDREPVVAGLLDRDLAATKRQPDWPEPPDYGRPPTSVGALTVAMDREIAGSLASARGESLALERRLRLVAEQRYAVAESARVKAVARVAELELTVKALGEVIAHAAGHDAAATEGGQ